LSDERFGIMHGNGFGGDADQLLRVISAQLRQAALADQFFSGRRVPSSPHRD